MLLNLHVKNLALIEEEDIDFSEGLNILTGETGAGKSIILGALSMALGGKANKGMLRSDDEEALVEASFSVDDQTEAALKEMDVEVYDGEVILSRKLSAQRAAAKVNGESVPAAKLKKIGDLLIDIYGQQEHVSLLKKSKHLDMLDEYQKDELSPLSAGVKESYNVWHKLNEEYGKANVDSTERQKELLFLQHEVSEIEAARLQSGEDEELEEEYRRLSHSQKIMEALGNAYRYTSGENASEAVGAALMQISQVSEFDDQIKDFESALMDVDAILSQFNRDVSDYISDAGYDEARFAEAEQRLDTINRLKDKYGSTIEEVLAVCEEKNKRIGELENYDEYLADLKAKLAAATEKLEKDSAALSKARKSAAVKLCEDVREELLDLNFLNVEFEMEFEKRDGYSANGFDEVQFMISLNPGTPVAPLKDIASGGELSRIMLAIKTVLARGDSIDTMIFDEIDTGISGRTAQAVANKLQSVSDNHQVICITHLPQIAAKAKKHFSIEKHLESDSTISSIHPMSMDERVEELARMLGGESITDAVRNNARELLGI